MGTKKDIGKVFQEKFKDFEQAPEVGAWDAIAAGLDGKSSNRYFVPLWITVGTIILVSVIGLLFWQPWDSNTEIIEPNVVVINSQNEDTTSIQKNDASENRRDTEASTLNKKDVVENANTTTAAVSISGDEAISKNTASILDPESTLTASKPSESETSANTNRNANITTHLNSSASKQPRGTQNQLGTAVSKVRGSSNAQNAAARSNETRALTEPGIINLDTATKERLIARERNARAAYKLRISKEREALEAKRLAQLAHQKNLRDSIVKARKDQALAQSEKEAKEKEAKNKENKTAQPKSEAEKTLDRKEAVTYNFAVSTYASLLSYGSLAKGSSIDDRLVDNPREAISTQGYGIRLEYNISERASFRFGVGVAPLKYQTNNFQVRNNGGVINVYQLSGLTPTQLEQGGIPTNPEAVAFFNDYDVITIEQNISYIEVPLDYQYKLINKRVGLSINPGVSVFILTDNNVFAIADDNTRLRIGRETSLNDLSFAFNLGLGGFYNFAKHWRLDVEPTFRYQLNPYSNALSNFRPYYLGVQFGATYKF